MPCIIYMHGNAGNKLEGLSYCDSVLPYGINLCCFDFSGCGNSQGEFVSLGHKEKEDLAAVIGHLRSNWRVSNIGLWGRSMGAVTSLLHIAENPDAAKCLVLDSGFSSMKMMMDTLGAQFKIPKNVIDTLFPVVEKAVLVKAGFQLNDVQPTEAAKKCKIPAFFLHGQDDDFIIPTHT